MPPKKPKPVKGRALFRILTSGIYTTLTRALREAVSNAYDAGANNVFITFDPPDFIKMEDPSLLRIQIRDDGQGMSLDDFWDGFASIEITKDPTIKNRVTGRFPIGQFGIGAFALTPFVKEFTIFSKKYQCSPIKCVVHASRLLGQGENDSDLEYSEHVRANIEDQEMPEGAWKTVFGSLDSGTVIVATGLHFATYQELVEGSGYLSEEDIKGFFQNAPFTAGLKEIAWELSTVLPLEYDGNDQGGVYKTNKSYLKSSNKSIRVELSEVELKRQLHSQRNCVPIKFEYDTDGVQARGIIIANETTVRPSLANGVILRLNNVGIGGYTLFDYTGQRTFSSRLTGEIHIVAGLHDSLNAARDRFTGRKFDALRGALLNCLEKAAKEEARGFYEKRTETRDSEFEKSIQQKHAQLTRQRKPNGNQARKVRKSLDVVTIAELHEPSQSQPDLSSTRSSGVSPVVDHWSDPVVDIKDATGEMAVNQRHDLFKVYSGKSEVKVIKIVLRALKLANLRTEAYRKIIDTLIRLRKQEDVE